MSAEVADQIESGKIETANHIEQMSVRFDRLLRSVEPSLSPQAHRLSAGSFIQRMREGGRILFEHHGVDSYASPRYPDADIARGWQAFSVQADLGLGLDHALASVLPFADDAHFAVREWAWLASRERVSNETAGAIAYLVDLVRSPSPYLRRFSVELTRPRSVWGRHLADLKAKPWLAEQLLEIACCDTSRYVQTSVKNWLRDSKKSSPEWTEHFAIHLLEHPRVDEWLKRRLLVEGTAPSTRLVSRRFTDVVLEDRD